jgi:hydrophobe/amphiphile efflux-1 (HAE1) family protein
MDAVGLFVQRPVATMLLTLGILLLGLVSYRLLPVASVPAVDLPTIFIHADLPGASPETMASSVATPLERQLGAIAGLDELSSINTVGGTTIIAQFDLSRDVDGVAHDVQAAINAANGTLPTDLPNPPFYVKANPNSFPILTLALTSDTLPGSKIYDYAEAVVAQKLSELDGVAQVGIGGAEKSAVRVQVNPAALAGLGLGLEDVRAAIAAATLNFPKGSIDGTDQSFEIAADDQLFSPEAFRQVVIAWRNGAPIRLGAVAKVFDDTVDTKIAAWWNGARSIVVDIRKRPGANTIDTVDAVRAELPLLAQWLPPSIKIHVIGDRTKIVRSGLADLHVTLAVTTALVVMVIALFLRQFWATFIPSVTIPVSIAGTVAVMYVTGCSLDNLSLMALTLSVGFIVDDAIVIIENVVRLIQTGATPMTAALRGTRQMMFTVISITAALLAALIPVLFMPGEVGLFLREFGITLCAAIAISAVVSLSLTPMLCSRLLPSGQAERRAPRALLDLPVRLYGASLDRALRWPAPMLGVLLLAIAATIGLFATLPKGLLPSQDTGVIRGVTHAPPDISFDAMQERQRATAALIQADPAVESVISSIGSGLFNALNTGSLNISLKPAESRGLLTAQVVDRLRLALAHQPGFDTYLSAVQDFGVGGRTGKARYQYTLAGPDLDQLVISAEALRAKLAAMPALTQVSSDQEIGGLQAKLVVDRTSAARLGVSAAAIDQTLYDSFGQRQIATLYAPLDQFKVVLEVDPAYQKELHALADLHVVSNAGVQMPLSVMTRVEKGNGPALLNHEGQLPAITLSFDLAPGQSLGPAIALIDQAAKDLPLPGEIRAGFAGTAKAALRSNGNQTWLLLAAIIAVYLILGMLYESYVHPLTIISTIPSAGLGALLALWVTRTELSVIALIGLILVIGIVLKNGIMMVDFAILAERSLDLEPIDAIKRAAKLRFRPIIMTTLSAALGAVPLSLGLGTGGELRQPLGIAIVGGLLLAQLATLYTTPAVYLAVDRLRRRRQVAPIEAPAE